MDEIHRLLIEHGIVGVVLGWSLYWIQKQSGQAAKERQELQEDLNTAIHKTVEELSAIRVKLGVIMRELDADDE